MSQHQKDLWNSAVLQTITGFMLLVYIAMLIQFSWSWSMCDWHPRQYIAFSLGALAVFTFIGLKGRHQAKTFSYDIDVQTTAARQLPVNNEKLEKLKLIAEDRHQLNRSLSWCTALIRLTTLCTIVFIGFVCACFWADSSTQEDQGSTKGSVSNSTFIMHAHGDGAVEEACPDTLVVALQADVDILAKRQAGDIVEVYGFGDTLVMQQLLRSVNSMEQGLRELRLGMEPPSDVDELRRDKDEYERSIRGCEERCRDARMAILDLLKSMDDRPRRRVRERTKADLINVTKALE